MEERSRLEAALLAVVRDLQSRGSVSFSSLKDAIRVSPAAALLARAGIQYPYIERLPLLRGVLVAEKIVYDAAYTLVAVHPLATLEEVENFALKQIAIHMQRFGKVSAGSGAGARQPPRSLQAFGIGPFALSHLANELFRLPANPKEAASVHSTDVLSELPSLDETAAWADAYRAAALRLGLSPATIAIPKRLPTFRHLRNLVVAAMPNEDRAVRAAARAARRVAAAASGSRGQPSNSQPAPCLPPEPATPVASRELLSDQQFATRLPIEPAPSRGPSCIGAPADVGAASVSSALAAAVPLRTSLLWLNAFVSEAAAWQGDLPLVECTALTSEHPTTLACVERVQRRVPGDDDGLWCMLCDELRDSTVLPPPPDPRALRVMLQNLRSAGGGVAAGAVLGALGENVHRLLAELELGNESGAPTANVAEAGAVLLVAAREVGCLRVRDLAREVAASRAAAAAVAPAVPSPAACAAFAAEAARMNLFSGLPPDVVVDDVAHGRASRIAGAPAPAWGGLSEALRPEVVRFVTAAFARFPVGTPVDEVLPAARAALATHWGLANPSELWPALLSPQSDVATPTSPGERARAMEEVAAAAAAQASFPAVVSSAALARVGIEGDTAPIRSIAAFAEIATALASVPLLRDAGAWLVWDIVFRPTLGPLGEYLAGEGGAAACASAGLRFVEGPRGIFTRVTAAPASGVAAMTSALGYRDAVTAAASLASYAAFDAPDRSALAVASEAAALAATTAFAGVDSEGGAVRAAQLLLRALAVTPAALHAALGSCVWLPAMLSLGHGALSLGAVAALAVSGGDDERCALLAALVAWPGARDGHADAAIDALLSRSHALAPDDVRSGSQCRVNSTAPLEAVEDHGTDASEQETRSDPAASAYPEDEEVSDTESRLQPPPSVSAACELVGAIRDEWLASRDSAGLAHRVAVAATGRLAGELYADAAHFVCEVLQNADDNTYAADVAPSIEFRLDMASEGGRAELVISNNERGFRRCDVVAICQTGGSTKTASGFIGKKGLGWKSVFAVTARPEVHSGHVCVQWLAWVGEGAHVWRHRPPPQVLPLRAVILCKTRGQSMLAASVRWASWRRRGLRSRTAAPCRGNLVRV